MMLPESHLYSFLDEKQGFAITFFEGQKLIHDLALLNDLRGAGFSYFRDSVLSVQPMISFLKDGEGLGIYIDSEEPYFRLKIETNESGAVRTLLLPMDFNEAPKQVTGVCRLTKTFKDGAAPYSSITQLNQQSFKDIMNTILKNSYQVDSKIFVSDDSDQSIMVMRLPDMNVNKVEKEDRPSVDEYWMQNRLEFGKVFKSSLTDPIAIKSAFSELGLNFLKDKGVKFKCTCSKDRMIRGIKGMTNIDVDQLFDPGHDQLETRCDYCKTAYTITKSELSN